MILLIFMLSLFVGGLVRRGVLSAVRRALGLGRERGKATSSVDPNTIGIKEQLHLWNALDDMQLDRLLKDSAP